MRQKDQHDDVADRLFDMVRDAVDDDAVTDAIASALRTAAYNAWVDGMGVGYKAGTNPLWIPPTNPHKVKP